MLSMHVEVNVIVVANHLLLHDRAGTLASNIILPIYSCFCFDLPAQNFLSLVIDSTDPLFDRTSLGNSLPSTEVHVWFWHYCPFPLSYVIIIWVAILI